MIAWLLWFFVALHLWLLQGVLERWLPVAPDLQTALGLYLVLHARHACLPGLVLGAALGRAVLGSGDVALYVLSFGLPVAALVPLRGLIAGRRLVWSIGAALVLAASVPHLHSLLARVTGAGPATAVPGAWQLAVAVLLAPALAAVLRGTPPLSVFVERRDEEVPA